MITTTSAVAITCAGNAKMALSCSYVMCEIIDGSNLIYIAPFYFVI